MNNRREILLHSFMILIVSALIVYFGITDGSVFFGFSIGWSMAHVWFILFRIPALRLSNPKI